MPEPMTMVAVSTSVAGLGTYLARRYFETAKEIFDIVAGMIAFIVFLPVMAMCALLIKVSSRGPVFYKQVRLGRDGVPFTMFKFRTMHVDSEVSSGAVWAQQKDPRVIPACRWMRISHVDELPQLLNVIKGDMSLIGPRPERPEILDDLERTYPHVRKRLTVRPGITGLAQLRNGYDTSVEGFEKKLSADLEYIRNRNWAMELWIILATFRRFYDNKAH